MQFRPIHVQHLEYDSDDRQLGPNGVSPCRQVIHSVIRAGDHSDLAGSQATNSEPYNSSEAISTIRMIGVSQITCVDKDIMYIVARIAR